MSAAPRKRVHGSGPRAPRETVPPIDEGVSTSRSSGSRTRQSTPDTEVTRWPDRLWSLLKVGVGVSMVVGAAFAVAWGAREYALTSPRFALHDLQLEGAQRRNRDQLARLTGLEFGKNIFSMDLNEAERKALEDPWIREVKITRSLPGSVRIQIAEREASAILSIGDNLYLTTKAGEPFKVVEEGDPFDLPIITGIDENELVRDRARAVERLQSAFRVLRDYERLPMAKVHLPQEIHLSEDGQVAFTIGKQGITLQLGQGPWGRKLAMAERVIARASQRGHAPSLVFLDSQAHPERVVVRMK